MSELLKTARKLSLCASLFLVACGGSNKQEAVKIRNISDQALTMSSSPESTYADPANPHYRGSFPAGQVAIANCIDVVPDYPESTSVRITYNGREGYISTHTAINEKIDPPDTEPEQQVSLSVPELERLLEKC